jgi:hypothetical protein
MHLAKVNIFALTYDVYQGGTSHACAPALFASISEEEVSASDSHDIHPEKASQLRQSSDQRPGSYLPGW